MGRRLASWQDEARRLEKGLLSHQSARVLVQAAVAVVNHCHVRRDLSCLRSL